MSINEKLKRFKINYKIIEGAFKNANIETTKEYLEAFYNYLDRDYNSLK